MGFLKMVFWSLFGPFLIWLALVGHVVYQVIVAILSVAILTVTILTVAILTVAILTVAISSEISFLSFANIYFIIFYILIGEYCSLAK
jgi:hypothetical protein